MTPRGSREPGDGAPEEVRRAVADAYRQEWAAVLSSTVRVTRDLDLAEDCAAEAYAAAFDAWLRDGVPHRAGAWLTTTARRRALDVLRREQTLRRKLPLLVVPDGDVVPSAGTDDDGIPDDRLRLILTCCHPALAREAQVALTLRLVCGLSTADIAHAFLVSESTMAARVTRAKRKIAAARIPYRVPPPEELPARLDAALTVLHLVYTTGYAAPTGEHLQRTELAERAIDLTSTLLALMPDEREVRGLLALMVLTESRRSTRVDESGRLVLLADQDRSRWDAAAIAAGQGLVVEALRGGRPGRFVLQAAIAALHAEAPSHEQTDWRQVLDLYDLLLAAWPSPVVALNRAVAVTMVDGPAAGLAAVDALGGDARLERYHYVAAARADLLRRLGRSEEAAAAYRTAIDQADNDVERAFLRSRLAGLAPG